MMSSKVLMMIANEKPKINDITQHTDQVGCDATEVRNEHCRNRPYIVNLTHEFELT